MTGAAFESLGSFDSIVVGAGSAGCVLANRLSTDPKVKTLLLEAGGRDLNPWIHVPVGYLYTRNNPRTDWCFRTQAEENLGNRTFAFPLGRVLGGCSSINGMLYVRGHAQDYDTWRQLGNAGWGWDDVLPYFKRSENFRDGPDAAHGTGGEWHVEKTTYDWDILNALLQAGSSLGIPHNPDLNSGDNGGFWFCQVNQRNGWRSSAATAFLRPARGRANLTVLTHAHARRIRFDGRKAVGVEFVQGGTVKVATGRQIVLASGAVGSPALLQRSGVGPADLLASHGIPVVSDLPGVGANLQDHLQLRVVFRLSNTRTMNERARSLPDRILMGLEYALFRRGPLTFAPSQLGGFARTDASKATPDLQFLFQLGSVDASGKFDPFPAMTLALCNVRPESRGYVRIQSADFRDAPLIKPNYLTAAADRQAIAPAIRLARAVMHAQPMSRYAPQEVAPGHHLQSDEDLRSCVTQIGSSLFHPVGTCKMGQDETAVVDARLNVRGLTGLRVVDASVMPTIVSGNTNAATVMIAEKGADMIREDGAPR